MPLRRIRDLLIFNSSGKAMIYKSHSLQIEEQAYSGFLEALHAFGQHYFQRNLTYFELEDLQICVRRAHGCTFVASRPRKTTTRKMERELEHVIRGFFKHFSRNINVTWNGDMALFDEFLTEISKTPADIIGDEIEALWR